jgi:hypothetical protein
MSAAKWETQKVHGRDEVLLDIEKRARAHGERVVQDVRDVMNDYEVDMYRLMLDQAKEWLVLEGTDLERGLKLYQAYFKPKEGELKITEHTDRKVVFRRKEFVNAISHTCGVLGLDIVEVNNKIYARATNLMFDRIGCRVKHVVLGYQDGWYDEMLDAS